MRPGAGRTGYIWRTAIAAVAVVALLLAALCAGIDLLVANNLRSSAAARLTATVSALARESAQVPFSEPDLDDPVVGWRIGTDGNVVAASPGAPVLPAGEGGVVTPREVMIGSTDFLLAGSDVTGGRIVVGESLASVSRATGAIVLAEVILGPVLLVAVFIGALLVGRRVASPIEKAHQRQLEFTADASHELRTPLSVIEAETSLALSQTKRADSRTAVLQRVQAEAGVMRRMVDDMLWLARFDASPAQPSSQLVDLNTSVAVAVDRFRAVAERRGQQLEVRASGDVLVRAPAEWIDRLIGVLLDNACKYSAAGGLVRISAEHARGRARLVVEDGGPGIPEAARLHIFDRFHREASVGDGAGLGLAIADAIVRATHGQWEVGESDLGGALFVVTWSAADGSR